MKKHKYTQKEEFCIQEYIRTGHKANSYKAAYDTSRMKVSTINAKTTKFFGLEKTKDRISELQTLIWEDNKATVNELVSNLSDMIRFDPAELYDDQGKMKMIHDIPKPARQMIEALDVQELFLMDRGSKVNIGEVKKIKLIKKLDAIEKLMKHLNGYNKHNESKKSEVVVFQIPDNGRS